MRARRGNCHCTFCWVRAELSLENKPIHFIICDFLKLLRPLLRLFTIFRCQITIGSGSISKVGGPPGPDLTNERQRRETRRRRRRGGRVGGGVSPFQRGGFWGGAVPPPQEFLLIFGLPIVLFGAL